MIYSMCGYCDCYGEEKCPTHGTTEGRIKELVEYLELQATNRPEVLKGALQALKEKGII